MKWLTIGLGIALAGSNVAWLYTAVNHGVTNTHREDACQQTERAFKRSLALVRLAKGRPIRKEMIEAARAALPDGPFEKDGETVVGELALKFDRDGAFLDVSPSWSQ